MIKNFTIRLSADEIELVIHALLFLKAGTSEYGAVIDDELANDLQMVLNRSL